MMTSWPEHLIWWEIYTGVLQWGACDSIIGAVHVAKFQGSKHPGPKSNIYIIYLYCRQHSEAEKIGKQFRWGCWKPMF